MKGEYTGKDGHRYGWLPTTHPGVAHCALDGDMAGCAVAIRNEDIPAALRALQEMAGEGEKTGEPIHEWFGLSYANYLVLQRSFLQSMPIPWQARFVALLRELDEVSNAWADRKGVELPAFTVMAKRHGGGFIEDPVPHYERGRTRLDLYPSTYERREGEA